MLLQSGLRGLCIFKPSCVLLSFLFFSLFFFLEGGGKVGGVGGRRPSPESCYVCCKVTRCLWLYRRHVMCFLSCRRWDKMFAALEIKDNQRQLVIFFFFLFSNSGPNVDLQAGTLDRMFPKSFGLISQTVGLLITGHTMSIRHNNILMVTVHPQLWGGCLAVFQINILSFRLLPLKRMNVNCWVSFYVVGRHFRQRG